MTFSANRRPDIKASTVVDCNIHEQVERIGDPFVCDLEIWIADLESAMHVVGTIIVVSNKPLHCIAFGVTRGPNQIMDSWRCILSQLE
jgi:hypothetical protein